MPVEAGLRCVATLFLDEEATVDEAVRRRFLPALASLLAVVAERSRLEAEALEAEALRRSDAIKTAVLRAVSHDLRSPLTAIVAAADALANPGLALEDDDRLGLARDDPQRGGAARPHRRATCSTSRGSRPASPSRTASSGTSTSSSGRRSRSSATTPRACVSTSRPRRRRCEVDAVQIERVLVNLLDNALKFSPPGVRVQVRAESGATELLLHVVDQGPGVPAEERERVFEPFRRGTRAASAARVSASRSRAASRRRTAGGSGRRTIRRAATSSLALPLAERPPVRA